MASRLKRSLQSVRHRRHKLGIELPPPVPLWRKDEDALLGTMRDDELGRRLQRTKTAVEVRRLRLKIPVYERMYPRWSAKEDRLLGKLMDEKVARRLGRTLSGVLNRRKFLRIPAPCDENNSTVRDEG